MLLEERSKCSRNLKCENSFSIEYTPISISSIDYFNFEVSFYNSRLGDLKQQNTFCNKNAWITFLPLVT